MPKTKPAPTKREVALDRQNQELRVALADVQRLMLQHFQQHSQYVTPMTSPPLDEMSSYAGQVWRVAGEALKTPAAGS